MLTTVTATNIVRDDDGRWFQRHKSYKQTTGRYRASNNYTCCQLNYAHYMNQSHFDYSVFFYSLVVSFSQIVSTLRKNSIRLEVIKIFRAKFSRVLFCFRFYPCFNFYSVKRQKKKLHKFEYVRVRSSRVTVNHFSETKHFHMYNRFYSVE